MKVSTDSVCKYQNSFYDSSAFKINKHSENITGIIASNEIGKQSVPVIIQNSALSDGPYDVYQNNIETKCGAINIVPIFNNDKEIKCRTCNMTFTVKITVPESSVAYDISQNLDK